MWRTGAVVIVVVNDMVETEKMEGTPKMGRTTSMAKATRLALMAGLD